MEKGATRKHKHHLSPVEPSIRSEERINNENLAKVHKKSAHKRHRRGSSYSESSEDLYKAKKHSSHSHSYTPHRNRHDHHSSHHYRKKRHKRDTSISSNSSSDNKKRSRRIKSSHSITQSSDVKGVVTSNHPSDEVQIPQTDNTSGLIVEEEISRKVEDDFSSDKAPLCNHIPPLIEDSSLKLIDEPNKPSELIENLPGKTFDDLHNDTTHKPIGGNDEQNPIKDTKTPSISGHEVGCVTPEETQTTHSNQNINTSHLIDQNTIKSEQLNRLQKFAALRLLKPNKSIQTQDTTTSISPQKMKLKFNPGNSQKTNTNPVFREEDINSGKPPTGTFADSNTPSEVEASEEDPLDAFMRDLKKTEHDEIKKPSQEEIASILIPQAITFEEIQGWNFHKHKWDQFLEPSQTSHTHTTLSSHDTPTVGLEVEDEAYHKKFLDELSTLNPGDLNDPTHTHTSTHKTKNPNTQKTLENQPNNTPHPTHSRDHNVDERLFPEEDEDDEEEPPNASAIESYFELAKKIGQKKELPPVDHTQIKYQPFNKNLYIQVKEISLMKDHEVEALRKTHGNIKIRGKNCPRPIKSFYQCGIPERIAKLIQSRSYVSPFPVQMQAIPCLMSGRDTIAIAETGSGKTLAYVLPLLRHVLDQDPLKEGDGPIALVIVPTRELALQIYQELQKFCRAVSLRVIAVYGGTGIGEQLGHLRRGAEVVVGTPGRLIDVLTISNGKVTNLKRVTFVVLDEADRMFDMGFEPQITGIIRNIRPDRQTCLFSATFPAHIEGLARKILYKPVEIIVGEKGRTASQIRQYIEVMTEQNKFYRLLKLLGEWSEYGSILIFVSRQVEADELFSELLQHGYQAGVLHGGQDQTDREFTIQDFKDGTKKILIATSVAARGLDVKSVVLVINYKAPDHIEDYVHRIGRTGRAGNVGVAYTFVTPQESEKAGDLVKVLRQSDQSVPNELMDLADLYKLQCNVGAATHHKNKGFGGKGFRFTQSEKSRLQIERQAAKKDLGMDDPEDDDDQILENDTIFDDNIDSFSQTQTHTSIQQLKNTHVHTPDTQTTGAALLETVKAAAARAKALAEIQKTLDIPNTHTHTHQNLTSTDAINIYEKHAESIALKMVENIKDPNEKEAQLKIIKANILDTLPKPGTAKPIQISTHSKPNSGVIQMQKIASDTIEALKATKGIPPSPIPPPTNVKIPGPVTNDASSKHCVDEFEINNYPQQARFKVTHKEVLSRISEDTDTICQIKGQYVSPDQMRVIQPGTKPLYIEITGSTPISVHRAKHQLRMLMETISVRQLNLTTQHRPIGRYSVI